MYNLYRLYYQKVLAVATTGNIDGRYFDSNWTATMLTFKGRTEAEALHKANNYWKKAQLGMGRICLKKI
jgi:hypothetical protein